MTHAERKQPMPWHFYGQVDEFFRIWIVNISLSVLTLGIYTAWAKVRTTRYFYGNTRFGGHGFDYHADPVKILIGRLIAAVLLIGYQFIDLLPMWLMLAAIAAFFLALPWLINASMRFNARMTSYRGIRFGFAGSYVRALWVFLIMPIFGWLTLGLLLPWAARMQARYVAAGYSFGDRRFHCDPPLSRYYKAYAATALISMVVVAIVSVALGDWAAVGDIMRRADLDNLSDDQVGDMIMWALLPMLVGIVVVNLFVLNILEAWLTNLMVNHLVLEDAHRFQSTLSGFRYAWILLSNWVLVILTLGLAFPWAKIRVARYRLSCLMTLAGGDIAQITAAPGHDGSVVGDQAADLFGVEVAI